MKTDDRWLERCRAWITRIGIGRLAMIGAAGAVLVMLSATAVPDRSEPMGSTTEEYTAALEARLEDMIASIQGAGSATVMVTLENTVEYVYANEEKTNSDRSQSDNGDVSSRDDSQKTVVTVDAQDGKQGLLVTEIQPTVRGVVVACEGASDEEVAKRVTEAVKIALNITDKRVCVIPYVQKGEMDR